MSDAPKKAVATLSTRGYVTDPEQVLDFMMACYLTSNYSQSVLFRSNIMSLQKQLREYGHDSLLLSQQIELEMSAYLSGEFDDVAVRISVEPTDPADPSRLNVTVEAIVGRDGKRYSLGRVVVTQNSLILNIINLNNEGRAQ